MEVLMNNIHVHINVKPEFINDFILATRENARNSILEPGIARFDFLQSSENPTNFLLIEVYKDLEAPAKHKNSRHYQVWREAVQKMMAEPRQSEKFINIFPTDEEWNK
jgi:(4S)-4-hydroxy-5-phosphonooxypentane-2,3-dione isomerase